LRHRPGYLAVLGRSEDRHDITENLGGDATDANGDQRAEAGIAITADDEFQFGVDLFSKQYGAVAGSGELFPRIANVGSPETEPHQTAFGLMGDTGCLGHDRAVNCGGEFLCLCT
jgi:hypothetical protein